MSIVLMAPTELDVTVHDDGLSTWLRFSGSLVVRNAAALRDFIGEHLDLAGAHRRLVVDLGNVVELDTAGLAAVTSPVFTARRRRHDVAVIRPVGGQPRQLVDRVGVLPIGRI